MQPIGEAIIRRGLEAEAMEFACELIHSSKVAHHGLYRLEVICHEDLDTLAAPHVFPFVATSLAASKERYSSKPGEVRLMIGNAIRMMCRAPKSRAGCHFATAIGLRSTLEGFVPTIPDWANDQHTLAGRKLGRGLDHFRSEGARLIPPKSYDSNLHEFADLASRWTQALGSPEVKASQEFVQGSPFSDLSYRWSGTDNVRRSLWGLPTRQSQPAGIIWIRLH